MSHFVTSRNIPENGEHLSSRKAALPTAISFIVGTGLTALSYVALFGGFGLSVQASFAYSWLFAFAFFLTLTLGGCFWTLLHNVINASWGTSVRRLFENLGFVFPFLIIFALPFFFRSVQAPLYEWTQSHYEIKDAANLSWGALFGDWLGSAGNSLANIGRFFVSGPESTHAYPQEMLESLEKGSHANTLLAAKHWFLNLPYFYVRLVGYFLALGFVIFRLRKLSVAQDTDANPGTARLFKARAFSALGLPVLAIVVTFAGVDLLKALDYKWFSTMWGVYLFAGSALHSMALLIILLSWLRSLGYFKNIVTEEHYHLMGKLLFAFVTFWAYIAFSQFFLIWYSNQPEETSFFILRNTGLWWYFSLALVFGHFALPFLLLLSSKLKKTPRKIVPVCLFLLAMHALDMYWIVIPERGPSVGTFLNGEPEFLIPNAFWGDILAFLAIGSGFVFLLLRNLKSAALYPCRDPRILESANVKS